MKRSGRRPILPADDIVKAYVEQELSLRDCAKRFGSTVEGIRRVLIRAGVKLRAPHSTDGRHK